MTASDLKILMRNAFANGFSAKEAHDEMMPETRKYAKPFDERYFKFRESAVALIIYPNGPDFSLVFIKRPVYHGAHSGQIAFPGGKREENDNNLLQTAIRESEEEIGIALHAQEFVGELSSIYIPVSNITVVPHVFVLNREPVINTDSAEVDYAFSILLSDLINDDCMKLDYVEMSGERLKIPYFELNKQKVWGATSMMTNELKYLLKKVMHQG